MRPIKGLKEFLKIEGSSGFLLIFAAFAGIVLANSPLSDSYNKILSLGFKIDTSYFYLSLSVTKVINYLLMSLFFLVIGMEIKRELISGHLSSFRKAAAPLAGAIGGMLVPALIYLALVRGEAARGWAIPMATDIALAVGVLSLMGSRVSFEMKTFLLALAVIDDIGAIVIIAFFYGKGISITWLITGLLSFAIIYFAYKQGFANRFLIGILVFLLWYGFYRSGVHPTIAGVLLGFALPKSEELEERLHPWASYLIVPIFALANAGIEISKDSINYAFGSVLALGIFLGMVVGKPLGILTFTKISSAMKFAEIPKRTGRFSLMATGSAAGIGFTVAIFIAELAFTDKQLQSVAILAVLAGSIVSALISILLNRLSPIQENSTK